MTSSPLSLRARLLLWLLVPLGLAGVLSAWQIFREARGTATRVQDRLLLGSARIIAEDITYEDEVLEVDIPPSALELFQSGDRDQVYYRIASSKGLLLSGYGEVPPPPAAVRPEEFLFFDGVVRGEPVRVVAYAQPLFTAPGESPVVIEVAQTFNGHQRLVRAIWLASLGQALGMMALVAVMVWITLRWGLRSLMKLGDLVRRREPGSLEPLDPGPVPHELQPLVSAQNDYIQRLDTMLAARNRFIANAAHQLRTPFAVLQTQADFALRSPDPAQRDEALKAMQKGVRDGTRLVNQLLSLSTAEAGAQRPVPRTAVDVAELVQRVLEEKAVLAQARDIDLGFEARGEPVVLLTSEAMLHELVSNLVDNALRYAPGHGVVTVSVLHELDRVLLRVEDNGPGIPPADRERVFERFFRLHPGDSPGSGLGLAIVKELAAALGADIQLADPAQGTGLVVTVSCPA